MRKRINVLGGMGAVVAALGFAVGCGDSFGSSDCHASRTCGTSGGSDADPGGAGGEGGDDSVMVGGGAAAIAGAADGGAGAAGANGSCQVDADCSNDVAEDGAEICNDGACEAGNPPPMIVSLTPEKDAMDVEPDASIVIEFSEPLDPKTVTSANIQVLDGETEVPGELTYADGKVTFKPMAPLTLLAPCTVAVSAGVTDNEGTPLLIAFSSKFSIRDGAWHAPITVAKDIRGELSDKLPMSADGSVLLAWSGTASSYCPASTRWFLRGEATTAVKALTIAGQTECSQLSSAANAVGVAAVVWQVPDSSNGLDVAQYRAGAWAAPARVSPDYFAEYPRVVVSPSGATMLFDQDYSLGASKVWTTDANGKWPADGDIISNLLASGRTSVALDSKGNGLAVWRAKNESGPTIQRVVASRLTSATAKWTMAVDLPSSVTATASSEAQRGVPAVAMDSQGDGMALWVDASSTGKLMASRFSQSAWAEPESLSGALVVDVLETAPGLVFDGQSFIAGWTAKEAGDHYTYTARYDLKTGWDPYQRQQTVAADGTSTAIMPALVSDGRGNLLLVFAKGGDPTYSLAYQRYAQGAWSPITAVPGGTITNVGFEGLGGVRLSMSANGLAALAWTNYENGNSNVRLASFY